MNILDGNFNVRVVKFQELDERTISAWESLEERALECNAYLSPQFVIPAMQHMGDKKEVEDTIFVFVENTNAIGSDLIGVGIFVRSPGVRAFPLPHLRAFYPLYSSISGLLVDRSETEEVLHAFFSFFCDKSVPWHGVQFEDRLFEGPLAKLMNAVASDYGVFWHEYSNYSRAVFTPNDGGEKYLQSYFSSRRLKEFRRLRRRLEEHGEVKFEIYSGEECDKKKVERFLELEHSGWKQDRETSLRSQQTHENFFREMIDGFREKDRLFFTELSINGHAIASTVNLISGNTGFAFKIGWHNDYAKMSPGILNEVEFIRNAPDLCGGLSYIDSGAVEGSFIDQLWKGRYVISSGFFGTTQIGEILLSSVDRLRNVKNRFSSLWNSAQQP